MDSRTVVLLVARGLVASGLIAAPMAAAAAPVSYNGFGSGWSCTGAACGGYSVSTSATSLTVSGDAWCGCCSAQGAKTFDVSDRQASSSVWLRFYGTANSSFYSMTANAYLTVYAGNNSANRLIISEYVFFPRYGVYNQNFVRDLKPYLNPSDNRIQVRLGLYDCWAANWSQSASYSNFQISYDGGDSVAPVVAAGSDVTRECTGGGVANVTLPAAGVVDDTDPNPRLEARLSSTTGSLLYGPVYKSSATSFAYNYAVGNNVVYWLGRDAAGNVGVDNQLVRVTDTQAPAVGARPTAVGECVGGQGSVSLAAPAASDSCAGSLVPVAREGSVSGPVSDGVFPLGTSSVYWVASDPSSNSGWSVQSVLVRDTQAPSIGAIGAQVRNPESPYGTTKAMLSPGLPVPSVTDTCNAGLTVTDDYPAAGLGYVYPPAPVTVTVRATDTGGNVSTQSYSLTLVDTRAPVFGALPRLYVPEQVGAPCQQPRLPLPAVTDNGDLLQDIVRELIAQPGSCAEPGGGPDYAVGLNTVTWRATDRAGNAVTANQEVEVVPPSLNLYPELRVGGVLKPGGAYYNSAVLVRVLSRKIADGLPAANTSAVFDPAPTSQYREPIVNGEEWHVGVYDVDGAYAGERQVFVNIVQNNDPLKFGSAFVVEFGVDTQAPVVTWPHLSNAGVVMGDAGTYPHVFVGERLSLSDLTLSDSEELGFSGITEVEVVLDVGGDGVSAPLEQSLMTASVVASGSPLVTGAETVGPLTCNVSPPQAVCPSAGGDEMVLTDLVSLGSGEFYGEHALEIRRADAAGNVLNEAYPFLVQRLVDELSWAEGALTVLLEDFINTPYEAFLDLEDARESVGLGLSYVLLSHALSGDEFYRGGVYVQVDQALQSLRNAGAYGADTARLEEYLSRALVGHVRLYVDALDLGVSGPDQALVDGALATLGSAEAARDGGDYEQAVGLARVAHDQVAVLYGPYQALRAQKAIADASPGDVGALGLLAAEMHVLVSQILHDPVNVPGLGEMDLVYAVPQTRAKAELLSLMGRLENVSACLAQMQTFTLSDCELMNCYLDLHDMAQELSLVQASLTSTDSWRAGVSLVLFSMLDATLNLTPQSVDAILDANPAGCALEESAVRVAFTEYDAAAALLAAGDYAGAYDLFLAAKGLMLAIYDACYSTNNPNANLADAKDPPLDPVTGRCPVP